MAPIRETPDKHVFLMNHQTAVAPPTGEVVREAETKGIGNHGTQKLVTQEPAVVNLDGRLSVHLKG